MALAAAGLLPSTPAADNGDCFIRIQNIELPSSVTIPNVHQLIIDAFDSIIAPTITAATPTHTEIKVFISRSILSNTIAQILSPLANSIHQLTLPEINTIAIHAFMLSGIQL